MSSLRQIALRVADFVRKCERNFPCPLLKRYADLPPIPVSGGHDFQLAILCQPKTFREALWSVWSWMRFLAKERPETHLVIGVDGEMTPEMVAAANDLFPGVEMIGSKDFVEPLRSLSPEFTMLIRDYRFGRKLAFTYFVQLRGAMLFSDCDIILFRRPDFLLGQIGAGRPMIHLVDSVLLLDPFVEARAKALGCGLVTGLNSGLLYFPRGGMQESLMKALVAGMPDGGFYWTMEQTFFAAIAAALDGIALPPETHPSAFQGQYFWEREIDYEPLVLRHFVGPTRHHFYWRGLSYLWRQVRPAPQATTMSIDLRIVDVSLSFSLTRTYSPNFTG